MRNIVGLLLIFFLFTTCRKSDVDNEFSISLIGVSPSEIVEFEENINVNISYSHNKGFIGFSDPDYLSLEVKDSRLSNADYYHLIPLSPPQNDVSITGEIHIHIDAPFILGNGDIETLTFTIRIQDKEKNWSNKITTDLITVKKQ